MKSGLLVRPHLWSTCLAVIMLGEQLVHNALILVELLALSMDSET